MLPTSKLRKPRRIDSVLTLSSSKNEEVSQNCFVFPESVWAKDSSKNWGLLYIFTGPHLHILPCSHTHIFSSSQTHTFTPSHPLYLHILTSSHLPIRIFTSPHLHIFNTSSLSLSLSLFTVRSSHLLIFKSSLSLSFSLSLSLSLPPSFSFLS